LHLREKSRNEDEPPHSSSSFTIEEKIVENDNEPKSLLSFFATFKKKTKDNDELGSQPVIIIDN
jgi:hypothetical protein